MEWNRIQCNAGTRVALDLGGLWWTLSIAVGGGIQNEEVVVVTGE